MEERREIANGRTHEPSLRELVAELDGLRDLLLEKLRANHELMDERDKRYAERDTDRQVAVEKALAATKEQTASAFLASREASSEAKKAQDAYNLTHNDLLRKMDDQSKSTMPRVETESRLRALNEKVDELRTVIAKSGGSLIGGQLLKDESRANLAILIAGITLLYLLVRAYGGHP